MGTISFGYHLQSGNNDAIFGCAHPTASRLQAKYFYGDDIGFGGIFSRFFPLLQLENCIATGCIAVTSSPSLQRLSLQMPKERATQNLIRAD